MPEPIVQILIVDDRPENLVALEALVEGPDRIVLQARSGQDCLALCLANDFALVLMDVQMPEMSGFEAAQLLHARKSTRHLPVVFVTANAPRETSELAGYSHGAVDFLFKPLDPTIVRSKVDVFVDLYRQRQRVEEQARVLEGLNSRLEQSNQDLKNFAAMAAHDLSAPMRNVSMTLELFFMRHGDGLAPEGRELLERIQRVAAHGHEMIDGLLKFSKVAASDTALEPISLTEVVTMALTVLEVECQSAGAVVRVEDPLPEVLGDDLQLRQVVVNLVGNAIKYRADRKLEVDIRALSQRNTWRIEVSDNGCGVPKAMQDRIFQVFARAHRQEQVPGTGIGLAVCRRIVERHGGEIGVSSTPGEGSVFWFTLPKKAASDAA